MKDVETKINDICEIQDTILCCLKTEIGNGVMNADADEVGKVFDMIKDSAQTEKYLREAKYYKLVAEAMEEDPENDRRGYTPRMRGNIRYGYKPMVDQEPYIEEYLSNRNSEYGEPYNEYMTAKRHYTQTGSMDDRSKMDMHAKKHIDQTIDTIKEIWTDATPELKGKIKSELKMLMDNYM